MDEVINYYNPIAPNQILKYPDMPAYSNESGIVVPTAAGATLDMLNTMSICRIHLESVDGVSLERIVTTARLIRPTGTARLDGELRNPGYKNSQYSKYEGGGNITVSPESFHPITSTTMC